MGFLSGLFGRSEKTSAWDVESALGDVPPEKLPEILSAVINTADGWIREDDRSSVEAEMVTDGRNECGQELLDEMLILLRAAAVAGP